jgi:hypothetical protein
MQGDVMGKSTFASTLLPSFLALERWAKRLVSLPSQFAPPASRQRGDNY